MPTPRKPPDRLDLDDFEEDEDFDEQHIIRGKWMMESAPTLSRAASALRDRADFLEAAERAGWQLEAPIEDDYGMLKTPPAIAALASEWVPPEGYSPGFEAESMNVTQEFSWRCMSHPDSVWAASIAQRLDWSNCPSCPAVKT